ncbi:hypothetical protein HYZ70_02940 [Candidatus Curtissbacteria bacterium]|nr:hypothetical protein [Candidatus Curtissbacteria bacterium]
MSDVKCQMSYGFVLPWILVAAAVVLVVLVLAFGIFDTGEFKKKVEAPKAAEDQQVEALLKISASDEVADIEKDINQTNLDTIDVELSEVEKEAEAL